MSFDLTTILVFGVAAVLYSAALPARWRGWALFVGSVICVYWLQSFLAIRYMDYILPTATLMLTATIWLFVRDPETKISRDDQIAFVVLLLMVIGMASMRFIQADYRLTASRPPDPVLVSMSLVGYSAVISAGWFAVNKRDRQRTLTGLILVIVALFVVLKAEPLAVLVSGAFRNQAGQDTSLASISDLAWLGFSYVAFRLIHTLRDRQTGKLPALSLREYVTYVVFFPAFIAGPIDRAERFIKDYRALPEQSGLEAARYIEGTQRIFLGLFKKFVIADSLALGMALNATNADQVTSTVGMWVLLYGYALRLFFDFSGYSDIAIGIGILFGIRLPENFKAPYLKTDIASFWQSWHITLSNWVRFYVFSPLSRALLTRKPKPSPTLVVLSAQLTTMIVIGLWHGITWNFLMWGLWHGVGLFIHKQWSDRTRKWYRGLNDKPLQKHLWTAFAWFITFHFVVIGWVWFALPDFSQSLRVLGQLFGVRL